MRKIWLCLMAITVSSCGNISFNTNPSPPVADGACPEIPPVSLEKQNVSSISLTTSGVTTESGQLNVGKHLGYTFQANAGDKLTYKTEDDICIWVFTPELNPLSNTELPKEGKYTIQVAARKGSTPFNIEMTLGSLTSPSVASPSVTPNSSNTAPPSVASNPPQPVPSSTPNSSQAIPSSTPNSPPPNNNPSGLTQDQASQIISNWLNSKSRIFAPPFDRQLVGQYTTGILYTDITKPEGSIDWLRKNNSRYDYRNSKVTQILSFSDSGGQPTMKVTIYEERTLYGPNGIDPNQSGSSTRDYVYFFSLDNGSWKIYDYRSAE